MDELLKNIDQCRICEEHLPLGPRPVVSASKNSKIVIIGQAPGTRVHASGIPWFEDNVVPELQIYRENNMIFGCHSCEGRNLYNN